MHSLAGKKGEPDDLHAIFEPLLVRVGRHAAAPRDIRIDKSEFRIGRGRENDEIILDTSISRKHCTLRREGSREWTIQDLSSTCTMINDIPIAPGTRQRISVGDIVQFSPDGRFRYVFTLTLKDEGNFEKHANDHPLEAQPKEQWKERPRDESKDITESTKEDNEESLLMDKSKRRCGKANSDNRILMDLVGMNNPPQPIVLDTIDLTCDTAGVPCAPNVAKNTLDTVSNIMDEQLTCSICSELFIEATTLNCKHTFCQYCIDSWNTKRRECPICRAPVTSKNGALALDNFIEQMVENLPDESRGKRKRTIDERRALERSMHHAAKKRKTTKKHA